MNTENHNDEIDLVQLFQILKNGFKWCIRQILAICSFFRRKAIIFIGLFFIGAIGGYFLDQSLNTKNTYIQELIIEPKYGTTKYIYDFVEDLESRLKDGLFLKKIGIGAFQKENIKEITITPIIQATDILDNLEKRYEEKDFFRDVVAELDEDQLQEEKFINFYKHHKIELLFFNNDSSNAKTTASILAYIKANTYFQSKQQITIEQTEKNLERNKKSLYFIDEYLENLNKNTIKNDSKIVVVAAEESDTPTIASLLHQKELLLETIAKEEAIVTLDKEIFAVIDYGDILEKRKMLTNRMLFLLPLLLCGSVLVFFMCKQLFKRMNTFVNTP